jgi:hypothetical protein
MSKTGGGKGTKAQAGSASNGPIPSPLSNLVDRSVPGGRSSVGEEGRTEVEVRFSHDFRNPAATLVIARTVLLDRLSRKKRHLPGKPLRSILERIDVESGHVKANGGGSSVSAAKIRTTGEKERRRRARGNSGKPLHSKADTGTDEPRHVLRWALKTKARDGIVAAMARQHEIGFDVVEAVLAVHFPQQPEKRGRPRLRRALPVLPAETLTALLTLRNTYPGHYRGVQPFKHRKPTTAKTNVKVDKSHKPGEPKVSRSDVDSDARPSSLTFSENRLCDVAFIPTRPTPQPKPISVLRRVAAQIRRLGSVPRQLGPKQPAKTDRPTKEGCLKKPVRCFVIERGVEMPVRNESVTTPSSSSSSSRSSVSSRCSRSSRSSLGSAEIVTFKTVTMTNPGLKRRTISVPPRQRKLQKKHPRPIAASAG